MRVSTAEKAGWLVAAGAEGLSLSEWVRRAANDQAALQASERACAGGEVLGERIGEAGWPLIAAVEPRDSRGAARAEASDTSDRSPSSSGPVSRAFERLGR